MKKTKYAGTQTEKNLMAAFAGEMQGSPRQETGVVPEKGGVVVAGEAGIVPGEMRPPFSLNDEREWAVLARGMPHP